MKSLFTTACTLSLLLAAASQAQAQTMVRDHRQQLVVRDHRVVQGPVMGNYRVPRGIPGGVRVTSSVTPTRQVNSSVDPFRQVERAVKTGTRYCVGPFCYHR